MPSDAYQVYSYGTRSTDDTKLILCKCARSCQQKQR